jgi:hypothetical protein
VRLFAVGIVALFLATGCSGRSSDAAGTDSGARSGMEDVHDATTSVAPSEDAEPSNTALLDGITGHSPREVAPGLRKWWWK